MVDGILSKLIRNMFQNILSVVLNPLFLAKSDTFNVIQGDIKAKKIAIVGGDDNYQILEFWHILILPHFIPDQGKKRSFAELKNAVSV